LSIFADAPLAALERLARAARPRSVPAGQTVFDEGDLADDLFVIVGGIASVSRNDTGEVNRLGIDDWFGEVGLIRGAPRNASVSAIDDLELLVISGRVFLDALNTAESLPDVLRLSVATRTAPPDAEPTRTAT
jgi:CRP-like cAMP-binding protein